MPKLSIHDEASEEYRETVLWYRDRNVEASIGFVAEMRTFLQTILHDPDRYPKFSTRSRYREAILLKYPFSIIYTVLISGDIKVIAIAHA